MTARIIDTPLGKGDVERIYTTLAPVYDMWASCTEGRARRRAIEVAAIRDGEAVLEVAVGTGLLFADVLRANPSGRNVGVDLTPAMLERAKRRAARVEGAARWELGVGDAYALAMPDAAFGVVLNTYMFDLLPERDFDRVIGELVRVLRPGGRLVLVNLAEGERWQDRAARRLFQVKPAWVGGCRGVALEPTLARAGLVRIERHVVSQWGLRSEVLRAVRPHEETGARG